MESEIALGAWPRWCGLIDGVGDFSEMWLGKVRLAEAGGPFDGFAEAGEFGGDIGADGGLERDDVVEDAEGVFAHFLAGEEFGQILGEVEAELERVGWDGDADVIVAQEDAAVSAARK